jgi:protein-disulfide isomerase
LCQDIEQSEILSGVEGHNFMKLKQVAVWLSVMIVTIIIISCLIYVINSSPTGVSTSQYKTPKAVSKNDIMIGSPNKAKVTLVEYADFQCSACAIISKYIEEFRKEFKDDLLVAYRFFPLNGHINSMPSSQTAYAAHQQGKYLEMSKLLYENQKEWSEVVNPQAIFTKYAQQIKLDFNKYTTDAASEAGLKYITDEQSEGLSIGIDRTPSFFINGKYVENPVDFEGFRQLIKNEINKN